MENKTDGKILIGNSFPMTLIRDNAVRIEEIDLETLKALAESRGVESFWGHANTRAVAEGVLGVSLEAGTGRPVVTLDENNLPRLNGVTYRVCYILSPEYRRSFRPAIGMEVAAEDIAGWHALRIEWLDSGRGRVPGTPGASGQPQRPQI